MNGTLRQRLAFQAWQELLDPGSPAEDVGAAVAVLRRGRPELNEHLSAARIPEVLELAPDRMDLLADLFGCAKPTTPRPDLAEALRQALGECPLAARESTTLLPVRRAHALFQLLGRYDAVGPVREQDVAWLFSNDEYPEELFLPLHDWCLAQAQIGAGMAQTIQALRDDEPDSPILDRLAAWTNPSVRGMNDLACWENGFRCTEADWRAAAECWDRGERDPLRDGEVLGWSTDPDGSPNAWAVRRAIDHHGERARRVLREAKGESKEPVVSVILGAWIEKMGGDA